MPTYLLVYRSATNSPPADQDAMAAWQAFFEDLGSNLVDIGNPIFARNELGDCSNTTTLLGGYSIIAADDIQTAVDLAGRCPELSRDGGVEVGEITLLGPNSAAGTDHDAQAASPPT